MPLSTNQLADLRRDLSSLGHITYDHLADELLDHYATLTEENMATGQSFDEGSTAAFLAMGNDVGIQQIQDDYETETKKQVKDRYFAICKGFLRWPTVVTTLLVGTLLLYLLLVVLPPTLLLVVLPPTIDKVLLSILMCLPLVVFAAAGIPYYRQKNSRHRLMWNFIMEKGYWPNLLYNLMMIATFIFDLDFSGTTRFGIISLFALGSLFQAVALAQLTRETFYYKPVFQR